MQVQDTTFADIEEEADVDTASVWTAKMGLEVSNPVWVFGIQMDNDGDKDDGGGGGGGGGE